MTWRPFLALVRKDLRVFLSDRRAVLLSFAAPLVLAAIFSTLGAGGTEGRSAIPLVVADEDQSPLSRRVVDALAADKNLDVSEAPRGQARSSVREGRVGVGVVIPGGFGRDAARGFFRPGGAGKPELTFLTDPTHAAEAGMVRGLFTQHALRAIGRDVFGGPGGLAALEDAEAGLDQSGNAPPALRAVLKLLVRDLKALRESPAGGKKKGDDGGEGFGLSAPFSVKEEAVSAGGRVDRGVMAAHSFAGMAVQFILFASVEAGAGLLTERQKGLWRRLRAAPVSKAVLLGSKTVSQALIALAILAALFGFGASAFGVRFEGSFLGFALVAVAYALTASTFGLLIAALGKTPQAARGLSVLAVLLMVLLGGAWLPMFLFPPWLQRATLLIPTRWAVDGLEGATWRGLGLAALWPKAAALFGFAALFGGLAAARFRWEED